MSKKTKVIKLTTANNSYKILVEYDPTTLSVAIKIRKGNDIYKQLVLSLHSLSGLQRIISEDDKIQSLMVLTGLSVLKTYLEEHPETKTPDIFANGSFRALNNKAMDSLDVKGDEQ